LREARRACASDHGADDHQGARPSERRGERRDDHAVQDRGGVLAGLLDEYANDSVPDRAVFTDHSIMGDYYTEGMADASAKPRHGERLASLIGAATDKELTARTN
jgi:hypothetical protein